MRDAAAGCMVAMEAFSSAHHWARRLRAMGLDARPIAANFVTPYRMEGQGGKNDATDAAAICEAAPRPSMRFVPVKSCEQQGVMSLHRVREGLKEERTACVNRIPGVLAEFGLVFGKSPKVLRAVLADVLEDASNELSTTARLVSGVGVIRPPGVGIYRPLDVAPKGISKHPVDGAILPR